MNSLRATPLDRLELALRRLPGVAGVGFTEEDDALVVHVEAEVTSGIAALRRQVVQHARASVARAVVVDIHEVQSMASADRGRVQLVSVRVERFSQEMEVHLAHQGVQTVGRASAGSPSDAVDATLRALSDLGAVLPFRVEAAAAPVGSETEHAVIVILEPEDAGGTRYGVARGSSVEEAAARATLHALNRYLSRGPALSSAS
ncbi:MAG: hypothetical protein QOK43_875 [Acidimicrobiaceae bacterium]|nr:hypothetical protein [Acidimicrobiaceae bacterium]MDQ1446167.1 hypothetical protein [Acidimicrobiaceae bacterium]